MSIFRILDGDSDGKISPQNINIEGNIIQLIIELPKEILRIFGPLLYEMDEYGDVLNVNEFVDASFKLYETLNFPDKNIVLEFTNKKRKVEF